jgi:hypothetical protein
VSQVASTAELQITGRYTPDDRTLQLDNVYVTHTGVHIKERQLTLILLHNVTYHHGVNTLSLNERNIFEVKNRFLKVFIETDI